LLIKKKINLENINDNIQNCNKCELCKNSVNIKDLSKGYGKLLGWPIVNKKINIMIVGMNPSNKRYKNLQYTFGGNGESFGTGFKFINLLKKLKKFNDLYITNLIKCSTPTNKINAGNVNNCIIHLLDEIDIIKPDLIIALGSDVCNSLKIFFKNNNINIRLIQIFHPNYIYRFNKMSEENYLNLFKSAIGDDLL
jgi:uracil-DNA glycosylase